VRNREGFFGDGRAAKTFATADWTTLKHLSHGPNWAGHRFYTCKCETHSEDSARPLDNSEDEGPLPPWKCGGILSLSPEAATTELRSNRNWTGTHW
jgi:hypothetical protein